MEGFNPLITVAELIPSFSMLASVFAYIAAIVFTVRAILIAIKGSAGPGGAAAAVRPVVVNFIAGACLAGFPTFLDVLGQTAFRTDAPTRSDVFAYGGALGEAFQDEEARASVRAAFEILRFLGVLALLNALFVFRAVSEDRTNVTAMSGVYRLIGGVALIHLDDIVGRLDFT